MCQRKPPNRTGVSRAGYRRPTTSQESRPGLVSRTAIFRRWRSALSGLPNPKQLDQKASVLSEQKNQPIARMNLPHSPIDFVALHCQPTVADELLQNLADAILAVVQRQVKVFHPSSIAIIATGKR